MKSLYANPRPTTVAIQQEQSVKQRKNKSIPAGTLRSKLAAYSVALAITLGLGAAVFYQDIPLRGQVATTEYALDITDTGFVPENLEVPQGGIVTITNKSSRPDVISSDTLCDGALQCLITPDLATGDVYKVVIALSVPVGIYEIRSLADKQIRGQITVVAGSVLASLPSGTNSKFANIPTPTHSAAPSTSQTTYDLAAFNQAASKLPQNINTGSPASSVQAVASQNVHSAPSQPTTGGWTLAIALIAAIAAISVIHKLKRV